MTTPLYKEALIESQKLRELAIEEAKQAVLNSITPQIKLILEKEISGTETGLFEEELPPVEEPQPPAEAALPTDNLPPQQSQPVDAMGGTNQTPPQTDSGVIPPLDTITPSVTAETDPLSTTEPAPIVSPSMGGLPVPGPDGNITVNIETLWNSLSGQTPEASTVEPAPISTPEEVSAPLETETPSPEMMPTEDLAPLQEQIAKIENEIFKFSIVNV